MFASASARVAGTTVRTTSRRAPRPTPTRAQIAQPGDTAILDTGTTLLPAAAVYAALPGARMHAQHRVR